MIWELGALGLAVFMLLWARIFQSLRKHFRVIRDPDVRGLAGALGIFALLVFVAFLKGHYYFGDGTTLVVFWFGLGMAFSLPRLERLEPARAVVVLGGQVPFRAMEAARIYRRGLVEEVWLTRAARPAEEAKLDEMGIRFVREETYNREVLERMGVPKFSICLLDDSARNTAEEVLSVARKLKQTGAARVILLTSKPHTRRVKATWRALAGDALQAEVRSAADDPYRADRWWRNTEGALAVSREFFGLLNVWAGFPVQPDRRP